MVIHIQTRFTAFALVVFLGLPTMAMAESVEYPDKPGFYPAVRLDLTHDDNIYRTSSNEQSDTVFSLSPALLFSWHLGKHRFTAQYLGEYAEYDSLNDENYDDHAFNAGLMLDLASKFNIDLQAGHDRSHEERGVAGLAPGFSLKPNEWKENSLSALATYGRDFARGQFQFEIERNELDFTNNNQDFRDRDTNEYVGRFYYRFMPKTAALFEIRRRDIDYEQSAPRNLDSQED